MPFCVVSLINGGPKLVGQRRVADVTNANFPADIMNIIQYKSSFYIIHHVSSGANGGSFSSLTTSEIGPPS